MLKTRSWQGVKAEVLRRISERRWLPGDLIPNEAELAQEFGCARATVNRALQSLSDEGLLDRKRKAGTRVSLHPVSKATFSIGVTRLEIEQRGCSYTHRLLHKAHEVPPIAVSKLLSLPEHQQLFHLKALHLSDNRPYLLEDRWVNLDIIPEIQDVDFRSISANEWLVRHVPFTTGSISFSASNCSEEEVEILGTSGDQALFVADRTTWKDNLPITQVRLIYAPGYRLEVSL